MIGLSLSFCIRDIMIGKVQLKDVEKIIAGTSANSPEHWDEVFASYKNIYWKECRPEEAEKLARNLIADGKIEQPRLTRGKAPNLAGNRHWVENEDEIVWC